MHVPGLRKTNTSQGFAYNFTGQITKPISKGWSGAISYTYGHSTSVSDGTSSTAASNWRFVNNVNGINNPDVSTANYDLGSRIVGYVSKRFTYANKRLSTTIGVVYTGQSGQPISYLYGANVTGDDVTVRTTASGLVYLPKTQAEAQFVTLGSGATAVSPAQQWADFQQFAADNPYIQKHLGEVTKRNDARLPWENHFDVKIVQDFNLINSHKLSIGIDILNVGNLINSKFGRAYYLANQGGNLFGVTSPTTNTPTFTFDKSKLNVVDGKLVLYNYSDYLSRFRAQASLKYTF